MENKSKIFPYEIDLNNREIVNPVRVCYNIDQSTKERLSDLVRNNSFLNASMLVDLSVNLLLNELENGTSQLVINLKK